MQIEYSKCDIQGIICKMHHGNYNLNGMICNILTYYDHQFLCPAEPKIGEIFKN